MSKSKYIPSRKPNSVYLQKKIDELGEKIKHQGKNIDAISKSHDIHITMLSNFARHDIYNSIQSMDSILSTNTLEELKTEHFDSLKLNLNIIRETIDNFSKLVPYSSDDNFEFNQIITAVELLNRESFYVNKIKFIKDIPDGHFNFNLPFQSVIQMINNIIINAIKAFDDCVEKKIKFKVEYNSEKFSIKIFDNATKIPYDDVNKIFDYGISSRNGSGIGLFHAKYLCELYNGDISVKELEEDNEYTKYFLINLPIIKV